MDTNWASDRSESSIIGRLDPGTYAKAQRVVASHSDGSEDCAALLAMLGIGQHLAVIDGGRSA
ncbi:hypothetical protein ONR57_19330 [Hoyosella sp. YIM 151337]|uniref:hypothetical protein n=1 Tax=Hoyosella sp. YIM 151337 TaxID=2992742 RepID=UPI0022357FE4|nr:hypothetical protein [Hoyosella sp. YIM 151337]MCW4355459.1 hypothetical protein [Hoyosella sp. YIM 151337]